MHKVKKIMCHSYKSPSFPANGKLCLECTQCTSPASSFTLVNISDYLIGMHSTGHLKFISLEIHHREFALKAANSVIVILKVFWVRDGVERVYGSCGGRGSPESFLDSRRLVSGEWRGEKKGLF